jgi:hypothetical protein
MPVDDTADLRKSSGCRAGRSTPVQGNGVLFVMIFAAFIVGYFLTELFIKTRGVAKEFKTVPEEFGLWTAVLGMVGGIALVSLVYCTAAVIGVRRLFVKLSWQTMSATLAGAVAPLVAILVALIMASADVPESVDTRLAEATRPLVFCGAACAVPGLMGLLLLRAIAHNNDEWPETPLCNVALILRLRADSRRLLGMLGALLTMLVIATGLRRRAVLALAPKTHLPSVGVVLYGFIFAALLGLFYAAANGAVDARASALVEDCAGLPAPDATNLVEVIERRNALNSLVGLGEGTWRTFQNVVVIAAPLLTALIGSAASG